VPQGPFRISTLAETGNDGERALRKLAEVELLAGEAKRVAIQEPPPEGEPAN
jgi:hypothetical protein